MRIATLRGLLIFLCFCAIFFVVIRLGRSLGIGTMPAGIGSLGVSSSVLVVGSVKAASCVVLEAEAEDVAGSEVGAAAGAASDVAGAALLAAAGA